MSQLSKHQDLSKYVLKMHGVYFDSQNNFTWLVTEFADGGELFDVACSGGTSQVQLQTYMSQLLQAVEYLHRHNIGHRDISLENVLLKDGICKLMDFGMAVASRSTCGTPLRYFRPVGKSFYRAPECYVPHRASISVTPPSNAAPGDIVMVSVDGYLCEVRLPESAQSSVCCMADVWGYEAEPADMFALGICMFILAFQCPAWQEATLSNQFFAYVHNDQEQGLESMLKLWKKKSLCPEAMLLLTSLLQINPRKRFLAADCLQTPWLAEHLENVTNLKGL
jgi:serine/threonine protein kinase